MWRHLPSFLVPGRRDASDTWLGLVTRSSRCSPVAPRRFAWHSYLCFSWQAWRLATSTFGLRGTRGTQGTGLGLVACRTYNCHTPSAIHNFVTHIIFHTELCHRPSLSHTLSFTRNFVTDHLCHTPSFTHSFDTHAHKKITHNFVTHHLSHTTLTHTIFVVHNFVTHNFVTYHLSHTTLSHTQPCHRQLCHIPPFTHNFVTPTLSHTIFHTP